MKRVITVLCSVAFTISGICLAVLKIEPLSMPGNMTARAESQQTVLNLPFQTESKSVRETSKDTVFITKHDTVQVNKVKLKYVTKVRIKSKSSKENLPAFSIKIPSDSYKTAHDTINIVSK